MRYIFIYFLGFLVAGCGAGLNSDDQIINFFSVQSLTLDRDNIYAISPELNKGKFDVEWDTSVDADYEISIYISNAKFGALKTYLMFGKTCETEDTSKVCALNVSTQCQFTNDNLILCPDSDRETLDLTALLQKLPHTTNIHFEICSNEKDRCENKVQAITFR